MPDTVITDLPLIAEDDPMLMPLMKATFRTSGLRVPTKPFSPVALPDAGRSPLQTERTT